MQNEKPPPTPAELDARLRAARARHGEGDRRARADKSGLGFAIRIGVEMVAALAVGVGIGLMLDRWLGTTPWFLLLFFVLGAAAGMMNVYRAMAGYGSTVGYSHGKERASGVPETGTPDQGLDRGEDGGKRRS
jgi:ATP synthase protein I